MKKCKWCGDNFQPHEGKKGNNQKYCSQSCRVKGYSEVKRKARKKYRQTHKKKKSTNIFLRKCRYCGKQFVGLRNNMYCSIQCKKYAIQEQSCRSSIIYNLKGIDDKKRYFDNLGNSNLREHMKDNFKDEKNVIKAELKRLRLKFK